MEAVYLPVSSGAAGPLPSNPPGSTSSSSSSSPSPSPTSSHPPLGKERPQEYFPLSPLPSSYASMPPSSSSSNRGGSDLFKYSKHTLAFEDEIVEQYYQRHLGGKYLSHFRLAYLFFLLLLLFKTLLVGLSLNSFFDKRALGEQQGEGEEEGPSSFAATLKTGSFLKLDESEGFGFLFTLTSGTVVLLLGLAFSLKRNLFVQYHGHLNLLIFLIVGLIAVSLSNIFHGDVRNFSVVAELYLLLFPFALLLKINFPRCVVGGWTLVILFFILEHTSRRRRLSLSEIYGSSSPDGSQDFLSSHFTRSWDYSSSSVPGGEQIATVAEITTLGVYLVLGVTILNFLAYHLERLERKHFVMEMVNGKIDASHRILRGV